MNRAKDRYVEYYIVIITIKKKIEKKAQYYIGFLNENFLVSPRLSKCEIAPQLYQYTGASMLYVIYHVQLYTRETIISLP